MAFIRYPRWLEVSGLPQLLNEEAPPHGYFIFKKLVEMDLYQNVSPDIIETSLHQLSKFLGLSMNNIEQMLKTLESSEYIKIFWGNIPEEELFLRIIIPVKTPQSPFEIPETEGGYKERPEEQVPYYHVPDFDPDSSDLDRDDYFQTKLEHVTNWYVQIIKPDLNPIVLQKIHYLCQSFSYQDLRQAFLNARKNKVRSLECLMRELYSYKKR